MKKVLLLSIAVSALISCNNTPKETTDKKTDTTIATTSMAATPPAMDSATVIQKWNEYMTPGDMHKVLAAMSGKWTAEVSSRISEVATEEKSTSACENKMIFDGRYMQRTRTGTIMGKPFEGMGIIGYDNAKKIFVSTWQDNMSTGILYLEGPYDAATKTITVKGTWMDPLKRNIEIRETFTMPDDKTQVIAIYRTPPGGKEFKYMEMKLARK